jgi:predicted porin
LSGVTASVSGVDLTDGKDTKYLDTMQYALSYSTEPLSLAVGYQDTHDDRANIIGVSGAYTLGALRFAAKVEQLLSGDAVIENKDPIVFNLYGSYTVDKLTYKAMYASGDGKAGNNDEADAFLIGDSYHFGVDYQHTKNLKFFTEYFFEENGYAIYTRKAEDFTPLSGFQKESDGSAILVGARYDF